MCKLNTNYRIQYYSQIADVIRADIFSLNSDLTPVELVYSKFEAAWFLLEYANNNPWILWKFSYQIGLRKIKSILCFLLEASCWYSRNEYYVNWRHMVDGIYGNNIYNRQGIVKFIVWFIDLSILWKVGFLFKPLKYFASDVVICYKLKLSLSLKQLKKR